MRTVRRLRPAPVLTAVVVLAGVVTPVLVGGPAGADMRTGRVTADYDCTRQGGPGTTKLTVTLIQDLPTTATAGQDVQPGMLTAETTLPRGALPRRPPAWRAAPTSP
ncbi:hypothetical protein ACFQZC_33760 [Streptacidiphilus monticola]